MAAVVMAFLVAVATATVPDKSNWGKGGGVIVIDSMAEYIVTEQTWR